MAGIGKYEKGKPFTLKSGNKPTFKSIGGSPTNLKNFGIGKGTSPYEQDEAQDEGGTPGWKKALGIGAMALTGGLDAVYGTGKIVSMSGRLEKKDKKKECPVGYKRNDEGNCVEIGESA